MSQHNPPSTGPMAWGVKTALHCSNALTHFLMQYADCANLPVTPQAVTADQCATLLQQVRRIAVQRTNAATLVTPTTALILSTWTALLAAVDNTKIISVPARFYDPSINGSEPVFIGNNDNTTPDGAQELVGETVPGFTGMFSGLSPGPTGTFTQIRKLFAEGASSADFNRLSAYIFCGDNQLLIKPSTGGGVELHAPFIGTPKGGQLHTLTQAAVSWQFDKEWFSNVVVLKLPFNHNMIQNPAS